MSEAQAVRDNIVRTVTLIVDNTEWLFAQVNEAVEMLSGFDHCDPNVSEHADCDAEDPCATREDWPTVAEVGAAVTEHLSEWIESSTSEHDTLRSVIMDLLDLDDSMIIEMFGEHYYPEDAERALRAADLWEGKRR